MFFICYLFDYNSKLRTNLKREKTKKLNLKKSICLIDSSYMNVLTITDVIQVLPFPIKIWFLNYRPFDFLEQTFHTEIFFPVHVFRLMLKIIKLKKWIVFGFKNLNVRAELHVTCIILKVEVKSQIRAGPCYWDTNTGKDDPNQSVVVRVSFISICRCVGRIVYAWNRKTEKCD